MKQLTRRKLFTTSAALPIVALAQEGPKPASRDEDLKSARESIAKNAVELARVEVPIATEPAFVFKA